MKYRAVTAHRPTLGLTAYLQRLLGKTASQQARTWLTHTWAAPNPSAFWRYWNPVYGYVLNRYAYRPLHAVLPRPIALWLTFAACGFFLHDLIGWALSRQVHFPEMTLLFAIFGTGVVAAEIVRLDYGDAPASIRVVINVTYVVACFGTWQFLLCL